MNFNELYNRHKRTEQLCFFFFVNRFIWWPFVAHLWPICDSLIPLTGIFRTIILKLLLKLSFCWIFIAYWCKTIIFSLAIIAGYNDNIDVNLFQYFTIALANDVTVAMATSYRYALKIDWRRVAMATSNRYDVISRIAPCNTEFYRIARLVSDKTVYYYSCMKAVTGTVQNNQKLQFYSTRRPK